MRILISETPDRTRRTFLDLPMPEVIQKITEDHGWFEVINMFDPDRELRMFFDVDAPEQDDVTRKTLDALNERFTASDEDWAICNGSRPGKISYHILSRKYKCSLRFLRSVSKDLGLSWIDTSVYYYDHKEPTDQGYFRLPNQSKGSIHKEGGPLLVEQGELSEFIVMNTEGLVSFQPTM